MRVVLASASPRRRELLAALVENFEVTAADLDETNTGDPLADAVRLAREKAEAVAAQTPDNALIIGSDTIVHDGSRAYGKPADEAEAGEMLRNLRGREHSVYTGVAVVVADRVMTSASVVPVHLADMDDATIDAYVASGRPLDKAGAYAIQDTDVPTVDRYEGCYCAVMGLPLWRLRSLLVAAGRQAGAPSRALSRCSACPERDECITFDTEEPR